MARMKRTVQWIDAVNTSLTALAGAASPGTIVNETIISEAELENLGRFTITRIVGDIMLSRTAGSPVVTATLVLFDNYPGAAFVPDWNQDAFERGNVLWSVMRHMTSASEPLHISVDVRSQRKMSTGKALVLAMQNHSIAGQDAQYVHHLRTLVKLA